MELMQFVEYPWRIELQSSTFNKGEGPNKEESKMATKKKAVKKAAPKKKKR